MRKVFYWLLYCNKTLAVYRKDLIFLSVLILWIIYCWKSTIRLTWSFSINPMKAVLSISTGWPARSYKAMTKWKKLDFLRLLGGCFSKCARPTPILETKKKNYTYYLNHQKNIEIKCNHQSLSKCVLLYNKWPVLASFSSRVYTFPTLN